MKHLSVGSVADVLKASKNRIGRPEKPKTERQLLLMLAKLERNLRRVRHLPEAAGIIRYEIKRVRKLLP
jgi:hypothetical protein